MKEVIETVDGVGRVLIRKSEVGEPLFVGIVKLGNPTHYHPYVFIVGTLTITLIVLKLMGKI